MPNFIDRLSEQVAGNKDALRETLTREANPQELALVGLVKKNWHPLPQRAIANHVPHAYAVDGSLAVRHLANGAYLFVAQALMLGEIDSKLYEQTAADVQILPGATPGNFVARYAELIMHHLEVDLAKERSKKIDEHSVIFLDGALFGQVSNLRRTKNKESAGTEKITSLIDNEVKAIFSAYLSLFDASRNNGLTLISIAKTSREKAHFKAWYQDGRDKGLVPAQTQIPEIVDSEIIFRWTDQTAGFSTPIILGEGSIDRVIDEQVFDENALKNAPAIVSFFIRPADFDDALRIDIPACCIGRTETFGDIEQGKEILLDQPADMTAIKKIIELLMSDYGGEEVYNALMYSVDREVRLRQDMMDQVYLSLIQNTLGSDIELRLDRSERRFHSR